MIFPVLFGIAGGAVALIALAMWWAARKEARHWLNQCTDQIAHTAHIWKLAAFRKDMLEDAEEQLLDRNSKITILTADNQLAWATVHKHLNENIRLRNLISRRNEMRDAQGRFMRKAA